MPGYCTSCHRVRPVRVDGNALALGFASGVMQGVCADCEQDERERRGAFPSGKRGEGGSPTESSPKNRVDKRKTGSGRPRSRG